MGLADLHTHTTASDGLLTPRDLVLRAQSIGLHALAITDHDTCDGIDEAVRASTQDSLLLIPGIEISTLFDHSLSLHMLGYRLDHTHPELISQLSHIQQSREYRAHAIVEKLTDLGFFVEYSAVLQLSGGSIGRPHLALAVIQDARNATRLRQEFGQLPGISDFIQRYIVEGAPAYIPKEKIETLSAISLIHDAGGVAVLAHPGYDLPSDDKDIISTLCNAGLDGLEVIYPYDSDSSITQSHINRFDHLADERHLLKTGGSDFHGIAGGDGDNPGASLGLIDSGLCIPYSYVTALMSYKRN